jgi:hypothetical protein
MRKLLTVLCVWMTLLNISGASVLSNTVVWELNGSGGNAANSAGFDPAQVLANGDTSLACTTATAAQPDCTTGVYNFVVADAGNWLYVAGGTNYRVGWYPIICASGTAGFSSGVTSCAANHITIYAGTTGCGTCTPAVQPIVTDSTIGPPTPFYKPATSQGVASTATPGAVGIWAVDYSQNTTSHANGTDLATVGATNTGPCVASSATHNFTKNEVGNVLFITSGTNFTSNFASPIVSTATNQATLETQACGGSASAGSAGTWRLGGARPLDTVVGTLAVAGNRMFVKGSHAAPSGNPTSTAGSTANPIIWEGYQTLRGDSPVASGATENRPTINLGIRSFTPGNANQFYNLYVTNTSAASGTLFTMGQNSVLQNFKCVNTSTTAALNCISGNISATITNFEAVSYRGSALAVGNNAAIVRNGYVHSSSTCISIGTTGFSTTVQNVISEGCYTNGATVGANTILMHLQGLTIYGLGSIGTGVNVTAGATSARLTNSIITGFATGVSHGTAGQITSYDDYNDYFNNTADTSNWQKGTHDLAVDPGFSGVSTILATGATATSTTVITKVGAFSTVTPGLDYLYLSGGAGCTQGYYGISAATADTVTIDLSTDGCTVSSADLALSIVTGHNFALSNNNLKNKGFPGAFPGGLTTGSASIGAQTPSAVSGGTQTVRGVVY